MPARKPNDKKVSQSISLVVSILILLGSVWTSEASTYYFLTMESQATVSSPEVILQNGTVGTSTIYTNDTDAKVSVAASNWLGGWDKRVKITVNSSDIDEILTDFPILIYLSNSSSGENDADVSFIFDEIGSNRKKIAVTTSDATTQCYVEIERWDNASEQACLWVKVPNINNITNTTFYLYYDNDNADNTVYVDDTTVGNSTKVWDSSFKAVLHLNQTPSGQAGEMKDSTTYFNHGTTEGSMNSTNLVNAKIGSGLEFDEIDDLIRIPNSTNLSFNKSSGTCELWINWANASDGDHQIILTSSNRFTAGAQDGFEWASQGDGDHFFYPWSGDGNNYNLGLNPFTNGVWHHLVVTYLYATKEVKIYVDAVNMSFATENVPTFWTQLANTSDWLWGGNPDRSTRYFDGFFDEIRIHSEARSTAWIKASYESGRDDLLDFGSEEVAWYDNNWNYRKKITIDYTNVQADLNDFPILVNTTDTGLRDYAQNDGDDILFAASDGTTKLSHEIEIFNGTTGQLVTWVKANISATISTVLYVYYDNPSASNQENIPDVWSNGYVAVWHLNGDFQDSTSNNHNGTNVGSLDAAGMMARGREFNPDDGEDHLEFGDWNVTGNKITLQTWAKCDDFGQDDPRFITKALSGSADEHVFMLSLSGSGERYLRARIRTGSTTTTLIAGAGGDLTANTWYLVAVTYDGDDSPNNIKLLRNGVEPTSYSSGSQSRTGDLVQNTWPIWAGDNPNTAGYGEADGMFDEIRISNVARSPAWLGTEYNNQYNSSSFHSFGIEEEKPTINYDYALRVNNTITNSWEIRLEKYSNSSVTRLDNYTIYFRNSTNATSTQIVIENGSFNQTGGPWSDLGSLETIYIAITVEANSTGTSYVYTYLEIRKPGTTTYLQYEITFEIT